MAKKYTSGTLDSGKPIPYLAHTTWVRALTIYSFKQAMRTAGAVSIWILLSASRRRVFICYFSSPHDTISPIL